MTLVEFLLARLAEDESLADRSIQVGDKGAQLVSFTPDGPLVLVVHPARVLAEVEAKRLIVDQSVAYSGSNPGISTVAFDINSGGEIALRWALGALALPYADHPDYEQEWRL